METVHVEHEFALPPGEVFRRVSDHERFLAGKGLLCRVTTPGGNDRNGLGAVRDVWTGGLHFRELITAYDPPHRFAYRIEMLRLWGLPLGFHHEAGDLCISGTQTGARLVWRSRFEVRLPLIGGLLGRYFAKSVSRSFAQLLLRAATSAD